MTRIDVRKLDGLPRFLTVQEVAKIVRVSPMTVYRLIENRQITAIRPGTGPHPPFKIFRDSVLSYIAKLAGASTRLRVDFNVVAADGTIPGLTRHADDPTAAKPGETVLLYDDDGNSMLGEVARLHHDGLVIVTPDRATWNQAEAAVP